MLVQLSGVPGSGKSTLARGLAEVRGMVVLDTDVLKSALLGSEVPLTLAGPATYRSTLAVAADLLQQGHQVVIDSPCRYRALLDGGYAAAAAAGVAYVFIELRAADTSILLPRLDRRGPRPSQVASAREPAPGSTWEAGTAEATLRTWQDQLVHPAGHWLQLDAAQPPAAALEAVLEHLERRAVEDQGACGSGAGQTTTSTSKPSEFST